MKKTLAVSGVVSLAIIATTVQYINANSIYSRPEELARAEMRCKDYTNAQIRLANDDMKKYINEKFYDLKMFLDKK